MTKKILIIGAGDDSKSALMLATLKEKYGDNIVLVTPEEAKEQGLKMEDFANLPTMKIAAPPIFEMVQTDFSSGKENRRLRRERQRKTKGN